MLRRLGSRTPIGQDYPGEIELDNGEVRGLAVHLASRIMSEAEPGEILVSRTVRDLVGGSGIDFVDRGVRSLKGVEQPWEVYAVLQT